MRHHKKEKAFGPSPNNGYTAGSPKRHFWQRKNKRDAEMGAYATKVHPDALPPHTDPSEVRDSYATDTTAVAGDQVPYNKYGNTVPVGGVGHHTVGHTPAPYTSAAVGNHQTAQMPVGNYHATAGTNPAY